MAYMQWNSTLETGIAVIDEQHKRFINYINELDAASRSGNSSDVKFVLDGLLDYTVTHFEFEETLMEKANYPYLKAHKKVHEVFHKRVESFVERANKGEVVISDLLPLMKVWLTSHIMGDDQDYVEAVACSIMQENSDWLGSTLKKLLGVRVPVYESRG